MFFNIIGDRYGFRLQIANIVKKCQPPHDRKWGIIGFPSPFVGINYTRAAECGAKKILAMVNSPVTPASGKKTTRSGLKMSQYCFMTITAVRILKTIRIPMFSHMADVQKQKI